MGTVRWSVSMWSHFIYLGARKCEVYDLKPSAWLSVLSKPRLDSLLAWQELQTAHVLAHGICPSHNFVHLLSSFISPSPSTASTSGIFSPQRYTSLIASRILAISSSVKRSSWSTMMFCSVSTHCGARL